MVSAACEPCTRRAARAGRDVIMRSGLMLKGTNTALMLAVLARSILPRGWRAPSRWGHCCYVLAHKCRQAHWVVVLVEVVVVHVGDTSRLHRLVYCAAAVPGPLALRQLQALSAQSQFPVLSPFDSSR